MNAGAIAGRDWARAALATGLTAAACYLVIATRILPLPLARVLFLLLPLFIAAAAFALGHVLAAARDSVALRIAVLFHIVAAGLASAMALVQNVGLVRTRARLADVHGDGVAEQIVREVHRGIDGVQLGLDLAWDVWITAGALLLAVALLRHPWFGRAIGWTGVAVAAGLLMLNFATFPTPPAQAGLVDLGPALALWYLWVLLWLGWRIRRP